MEDKFESKQKQESAIANFKNLKKHAGWQLLVEIIKSNIEAIRDQILTGLDETGEKIPEVMMNSLRDKLKVRREVINTPDDFIKKYSNDEVDEPVVDVYPTVESEAKERKGK